jgi:hypothetical protein
VHASCGDQNRHPESRADPSRLDHKKKRAAAPAAAASSAKLGLTALAALKTMDGDAVAAAAVVLGT